LPLKNNRYKENELYSPFIYEESIKSVVQGEVTHEEVKHETFRTNELFSNSYKSILIPTSNYKDKINYIYRNKREKEQQKGRKIELISTSLPRSLVYIYKNVEERKNTSEDTFK